jgi:dihydrofolate reductase
MTAVSFDISMSLDGYIAAPNRRSEQPLGDNGERLHEWAFSTDAVGREVLARGVESAGAVICGRRTYDDSIKWWGADGPTGPARLPVFVVSHDAPADVPEGGVYHFVSGGIEQALAEAKGAAGEKNVSVMGGADIGQQFIRDGLVDELSIHLVPLMFGGGTRLFENVGERLRELEVIDVIPGPTATHIRYGLRKEQ